MRALGALRHEDRCFMLGYLAVSVPDAVDLALAALSSTLFADLPVTPTPSTPPARDPGE